jgi:hypothetical protein
LIDIDFEPPDGSATRYQSERFYENATCHKIVNGAGTEAQFLTDIAHAKDATGLCLVAHIQFTPVRVG